MYMEREREGEREREEGQNKVEKTLESQNAHMLRLQTKKLMASFFPHGKIQTVQGIFQTSSRREINTAISSYHEFNGSQSRVLFT